MTFEARSLKLLNYVKLNEKYVEFATPVEDRQSFDGDPSDLHLLAIRSIANYVKEYTKDGEVDKELDDLRTTAEFYDAVSADVENRVWSCDYWLLGAISYFFIGNYGSAIVALRHAGHESDYGQVADVVSSLMRYLLSVDDVEPRQFVALAGYLRGDVIPASLIERELNLVCRDTNAEDYFFSNILRVIVGEAIRHSARSVLESHSRVDFVEWKSYLTQKGSPKILWPAQREIARAGVFSGENAVIQLPTGTGKTYAISLMIRSRFYALRDGIAIVVAPLRALCREIANDLRVSLKDIVEVHLLSDDASDQFEANQVPNSRITYVMTPEKLLSNLREQSLTMNSVRLLIFDEVHLLDDDDRGAKYELLLSELFVRHGDIQRVLISAVLPNVDDLSNWAHVDGGHVVSNPRLDNGVKAVGFLSTSGMRVEFTSPRSFYENRFSLDIGSLEQSVELIGREWKERHFPELTNRYEAKRDLMVSIANQLVVSGPCGLFVPQHQSIRKLCERLHWLQLHGVHIENLLSSISSSEREKLIQLVSAHYGEADPLIYGCSAGVLPHYGALFGSLRLVIESFIIEGSARCVACTSTLAEGVNLPIKYLIVSGVRQSSRKLKSRVFHNLLGRTARAGKHSSGTVILIGNPASRGDYADLVHPDRAEPCYGSLVDLVCDRQVKIGKQLKDFDSLDLLSHIISNISSITLEDHIRSYISQKYGGKLSSEEVERLTVSKLRCLGAVESYLAGFFVDSSSDFNVDSLCEATYGYSVCPERYRAALVQLFRAVNESMRVLPVSQLMISARSQLGLRASSHLLEWVCSAVGAEFLSGGCRDLRCLLGAFLEFNPAVSRSWNVDGLVALTDSWLHGNDLGKMLQVVDPFLDSSKLNRNRLEAFILNSIRYELCAFVSSLSGAYELCGIDLASLQHLNFLERCIRFGVSSLSELVFCESVLDDRYIARCVVELIGSYDCSSRQELLSAARPKGDVILRFASALPGFCYQRIVSWLFN